MDFLPVQLHFFGICQHSLNEVKQFEDSGCTAEATVCCGAGCNSVSDLHPIFRCVLGPVQVLQISGQALTAGVVLPCLLV